MSQLIEKFCSTKNTNYLDKLTSKEKEYTEEAFNLEISKKVKLDKINIEKFENKRDIITAYFSPLRLECKHLTKKNWGDYWEDYKLSRSQKSLLFYTTYIDILRKGLDINLKNFNNEQLKKMFDSVDKIYFNSKFSKFLNDGKTSLKLEVTENKNKVAGYCKFDRCFYIISLSRRTHSSPFVTKKQHKQKIGDIDCYSALECILNTFIHELVHLMIMAFCPEKDVGCHSKLFRTILYNLAGHTDITHSFGVDQTFNEVNKKDLRIGQLIYFNSDKKGEIEGTIQKINNKTVKVKEIIYDDEEGIIWTVPIQILYIKDVLEHPPVSPKKYNTPHKKSPIIYEVDYPDIISPTLEDSLLKFIKDKSELTIGQVVYFSNLGQEIRGIVEKIKIKYVIVNDGKNMWNIPFQNLYTKVKNKNI